MNRRDLSLAVRFVALAIVTTMLAGCATLQVKLGFRVDLAKVPVTAMAATLPQGSSITPGGRNPIQLTFTEANGKVLTTSGIGKGKVMWRQIAVTPSVVTVGKKGVLHLAPDPRQTDGMTGHVDITVPTHPDLHASLTVPVRYDTPFFAEYNGSTGSSGTNGQDGQAGSNGSTGSFDPDNPSAGGDGGNGTDGTNGSDGGDGGDGPLVHIDATMHPGTGVLVEFAVTVWNATSYFLVDPSGGTMFVSAAGGRGGSGGSGGRGGSGGSGGSGSPSGSNGSSGHDGTNGSDGRDGSGGSITVTYDAAVKPYLNILNLSNPGGPAPVLTQGVVPPLW